MTSEKLVKLPVWKTIADVYIVTARHALDLLRFAWPWLVALAVISGALYAAYYDAERASTASGGTGTNSLWILTLAASTIIGALIAVPWHRRILLGEHQTLGANLWLNTTKLAYTAKAVAIMAALCLPLTVIKLADPAAPDTEAKFEFALNDIWPIIVLSVVLVLLFAFNRWSLILPATAVGNHTVTLARAWRATRGNTLRLMLVSVVATLLPIFIPFGLVYWLAPDATEAMDASSAGSAAVFAAANTIWELFAILAGMLFVTFLSLAYRHFFGPVDSPANPH